MAAEAYNRDGGLSGLSTGLADLDAKLGGLHASDLIIIAARPSMGKSALGLNIAFDVARHYAWEPSPEGGRRTVNGGVAAFFSLEMSAEQLSMRILAEVSGVPSDKIRKGEITAAEFGRIRDASLEIQEVPLYIDDTGAISIGKLAARARRLKRSVGLDLVVIDYVQLMTADGAGRERNRVQEVTQITQALKALAKELEIPIIALAQLSRQVENREDKRPQLADLRESGSIEQDADVVMSIFREEYYLSRTEPREGTPEHLQWQEDMDKIAGVAEIIIGKQRHGPIGTVKMRYINELTKFTNLARDNRYEQRERGPPGPRQPAPPSTWTRSPRTTPRSRATRRAPRSRPCSRPTAMAWALERSVGGCGPKVRDRSSSPGFRKASGFAPNSTTAMLKFSCWTA
jgi:replicative DNA helicase